MNADHLSDERGFGWLIQLKPMTAPIEAFRAIFIVHGQSGNCWALVRI